MNPHRPAAPCPAPELSRSSRSSHPGRLAALLLSAVLVAQAPLARAAGGDLSAAASSGLSLPVAVIVAAPSALLVGGAALTVASVEAAGESTVWVVERASDGVRGSLRVAGAGSVAAGAVITVTAVGAGWLLSTAGRVIAWVPNEAGRRLSHHARVSP